MKKTGVGQVLKIRNNYGIIRTKSLNKRGDIEEIPFEITQDMLIDVNGESFVKYSYNVEFEQDKLDGIRRQGRIIQSTNLSFTGEEKLHKRNYLEETYIDKIMRKFKEFNFDTSDFDNLDNKLKLKKLNEIGFKPRMLDYLINGVFLESEYKQQHLETFGYDSQVSPEDLKLEPERVVLIDKIDRKFRLYLIEWILQIEDVIKSYLSELATNQRYYLILNDSLRVWVEKKGDKHITSARKEKLFRPVSDEYDYVCKDFSPFEDFLNQLDLTELREFFEIWYDKCPRTHRTGKIECIHKTIKLFGELSILRNAAAHGRPIIPGFMDPDYNANWELEFDFTQNRTKLINWELYSIFKKYWDKQSGMKEEHIPSVIQTIYGNKFRKSWVILNYIYFTLVQKIDLEAFEYFKKQAIDFLRRDTLNLEVNLFNLKLSDMGSITYEDFTGVPDPYEEIVGEANIIWNHYNYSIE